MLDILKHENKAINAETLKEERYIWMARSFALVALFALLANIFMLVALSGLTPLVRIQPFYLSMKNKDDQVVDVKRFFNHESTDVQISLIREYVMARYGIGSNVEEAKHNWGPDGLVAKMSEKTVWDEFVNVEYRESIDRLDKETFTRDVKIDNVQFLENLGGGRTLWSLEMRTEEKGGKTLDSFQGHWIVVLEVFFEPTRPMSWEQRLMNPLGFRVKQFSIRDFSEKDELMKPIK